MKKFISRKQSMGAGTTLKMKLVSFFKGVNAIKLIILLNQNVVPNMWRFIF